MKPVGILCEAGKILLPKIAVTMPGCIEKA